MGNINGIDVYSLAGTGSDPQKDTMSLIIPKV